MAIGNATTGEVDMRGRSRMPIKVLANRDWSFELQWFDKGPKGELLPFTDSLVGGTGVVHIKKSPAATEDLQTLTIGSGLIVTDYDKNHVLPQPLPIGDYFFDAEFITLSGNTHRMGGRISSTYE